jgi:hypothetical protein
MLTDRQKTILNEFCNRSRHYTNDSTSTIISCIFGVKSGVKLGVDL